MSETSEDRYRIQDLLPDFVTGRLDEAAARDVEAAVARDRDLREEMALLRDLLAARPEVPGGLESRIAAAVRADRARDGAAEGAHEDAHDRVQAGARSDASDARRGDPWSPAGERARLGGRGRRVRSPVRLALGWGLAAAAAAVLALGTTEIVERRMTAPDVPGPMALVALDESAGSWSAGDAMMAGAPVLDELSDDDLVSLLEEMGG